MPRIYAKVKTRMILGSVCVPSRQRTLLRSFTGVLFASTVLGISAHERHWVLSGMVEYQRGVLSRRHGRFARAAALERLRGSGVSSRPKVHLPRLIACSSCGCLGGADPGRSIWVNSEGVSCAHRQSLISFPLTLISLASLHAQEVRTGADAFGTWEGDAPGVSRHIRPTDLPPPSHHENDPEEPDFKRMPKVVEAPQGKMPDVPKGFAVQVFAKGLKQPRVIRIAPNGDIFVAESGSGRVLVFPADAAKGGPATPEVFAENLERPFGIVFHPPSDPQHVYVAAANQVVRYPYRKGDRKATGPAEVIIANIPTSRHWTRDLAVSRDGKRLFVSIGSASNVAATMPEKSPRGNSGL